MTRAALASALALAAPALALLPPLGPEARLIPRAGLSALLFGGGGYGGASLGINAGAGLALGVSSPYSVRLDYTARRFLERELEDEGLTHAVTLGISWPSED